MKVLATGVFDLLHVEHVRFLEAAKKAGDRLVVGIESDKRVRELKGAKRPIIPEGERLEMIKALKFVDEAFIIPENYNDAVGWKKLLQETKAEIYAISENSPHMETKKLLCQETGVELRVVWPENAAMSTSKIIDMITRIEV